MLTDTVIWNPGDSYMILLFQCCLLIISIYNIYQLFSKSTSADNQSYFLPIYITT